MAQRRSLEFYGENAAGFLKRNDKHLATVLKAIFIEFYDVTPYYIDQWRLLEKHPANVVLTLLKNREVQYKEVIEKAKQAVPLSALADKLFDEVSALNNLQKNIPDKIFNENGLVDQLLVRK